MSKPPYPSEEQLLGSMDSPVGQGSDRDDTHHESKVGNPLELVFAYRAFDLHDRFPEPLETFQQALECLQSDHAYNPGAHGEIVAYLRGHKSLKIPKKFFCTSTDDNERIIASDDRNDSICAEVEKWLCSEIKQRSDILAGLRTTTLSRYQKFQQRRMPTDAERLAAFHRKREEMHEAVARHRRELLGKQP